MNEESEIWKAEAEGRKRALEALTQERDKLLAAITEHHAQKADDRCIEDDDRLYTAAGLPPCDRHVGDKVAMLRNCARFIDRRCQDGNWPSYVELEGQLKEAVAERDSAINSLTFHGHRVEALRNEGSLGMPQGNCRCPICSPIFTERDEADRRAGAAERQLETIREGQQRTHAWFNEAKADWGVDQNESFDIVWEAALKLKRGLPDLALEIMRSQSDPGAFTPRHDNFQEPLNAWLKRALLIVLSQYANSKPNPS